MGLKLEDSVISNELLFESFLVNLYLKSSFSLQEMVKSFPGPKKLTNFGDVELLRNLLRKLNFGSQDV